MIFFFTLWRFFLLGMIVMTAGYIMTRYFLSSSLRESFEQEWDDMPEETRGPQRKAWVDAKMKGLIRGIRIRSFLLAYVVPSFAVSVIWFVVN